MSTREFQYQVYDIITDKPEAFRPKKMPFSLGLASGTLQQNQTGGSR
jgi:hypothetical protein